MKTNNVAPVIKKVLMDNGVDVKVVSAATGGVVNRIELELANGVRYSAVEKVANKIKKALAVENLRMELPICNSDRIAIECPRNAPKPFVLSKSELTQRLDLKVEDVVVRKVRLPFVVGRKPDGAVVAADLAELPHLFVGGSKGDGAVDSFLSSFAAGLTLARTKDEVQLVLADSSRRAFDKFDGDDHLLVPVIHDVRKIVFALKWAVEEMIKRLTMFSQVHIRNIGDFNQRTPSADEEADIPRTIPYVVIVIAELADFLKKANDDSAADILRLAQKACSVGIHLVLGTERPNTKKMVNILLTVPGRIAFRTATKKDSAAIVGGDDAAGLLKDGDCLYIGKDGAKVRLQAPRVPGKIRQRKTPIRDVNPFCSQEDDLAKIIALAKSRGVGIGEIIAEAVHEYVVRRT